MKEIYHVQRSKNENWLRCQLSQNWSSGSMRSQSSTLFLPIVITIDLLSLCHVKTKVTEDCFWVYGAMKKIFKGRMERKLVIYSQEASLFRTWAKRSEQWVRLRLIIKAFEEQPIRSVSRTKVRQLPLLQRNPVEWRSEERPSSLFRGVCTIRKEACPQLCVLSFESNCSSIWQQGCLRSVIFTTGIVHSLSCPTLCNPMNRSMDCHIHTIRIFI